MRRHFLFFEKVASHLIWIFFWSVLILIARGLCPICWLFYTDRGLMTLIFFHLFILDAGSRHFF